MYEPNFFVTSVGQIELRGPFVVNITLPVGVIVPEGQMPRLVYWNDGKKTILKDGIKVSTQRVFN